MLDGLDTLLRKPLNLLPWRIEGKLASLLGVVVGAAVVAGVAHEHYGLPLLQARTLLVLLIALGLWISEAVPAFAVSLAVVATQVFFLEDARSRGSEVAFAEHTQAWSSPVIWLILGGFVLSLGMSITQLDRMFAMRLLALSKGRTAVFLALIISIAALLSMFMSNTATTALLVSVVTPLLRNPAVNLAVVRATLLGIAAAATVGGLGTVIGSSPNALALAHFSAVQVRFDFIDWLKVGVPLVVLILVPVFVLLMRTKDMPATLGIAFQDDGPEPEIELTQQDQERLVWQRRIVIGTFASTVLLWMTSPLHSWSIAAVAFLPVVVFTVTGIVRDQHIRQLPWDTLLFVMGGIALGQSVSESGLARSLVDLVPLADLAPQAILLGLAYLTMFLSNFLSNTATAALLIPLASVIMPDKPVLPILVIALAASTALFLPISTPTNAVVYATGLLAQRDFRQIGALVGLIGPPLIVALCLILNVQ